MLFLNRVISCIVFIIYFFTLREIFKVLDKREINKKKDEMFAAGHSCDNCIWSEIEDHKTYDYAGILHTRKKYYCLLSRHLVSKDYISGKGIYRNHYCEDIIGTEQCKWERDRKEDIKSLPVLDGIHYTE